MNKVYVFTYNTSDKRERRMIGGVFTTREKANEAYKKLRANLGDFMCDYEISEHTLV